MMKYGIFSSLLVRERDIYVNNYMFYHLLHCSLFTFSVSRYISIRSAAVCSQSIANVMADIDKNSSSVDMSCRRHYLLVSYLHTISVIRENLMIP